jgi:acetyltransferase
MSYTMSFREQVTLKDGSAVTLRAIHPTDKAGMSACFRLLSSRSRRQRFLSAKNGLTEAELSNLTECDGTDDYALVAEMAGDDERRHLIGVARFSRTPLAPRAAELAIAVADAWQGRGVGRRLVDGIIRAAAERGIARMYALTLAENQQIRALLQPYTGGRVRLEDDGLLCLSFDVLSCVGPVTISAFLDSLRQAARAASLLPIVVGWAPLLGRWPGRPSVAATAGEQDPRC